MTICVQTAVMNNDGICLYKLTSVGQSQEPNIFFLWWFIGQLWQARVSRLLCNLVGLFISLTCTHLFSSYSFYKSIAGMALYLTPLHLWMIPPPRSNLWNDYEFFSKEYISIAMRPFGKAQSNAMRAYSQSGQYHTIVRVVVPNR